MVGRSETAESSTLQRRGFDQAVDASRGQVSRETGIAVRRFEDQLDRRGVIRAELPDPVAKSIRAPVQRMLLAGLAVELIGDPVEHKSAVGDPVGEPPRHRAERWRVGEVVFDRVEAEHDPLQPVGGRHDEVAHDRAPSQNFRARPCLGGDRDLEHRRSIDLAKTSCAHLSPQIARDPQAALQFHPTTGACTSVRSSSARIEAKTSRNIASVSTPVFVL